MSHNVLATNNLPTFLLYVCLSICLPDVIDYIASTRSSPRPPHHTRHSFSLIRPRLEVSQVCHPLIIYCLKVEAALRLVRRWTLLLSAVFLGTSSEGWQWGRCVLLDVYRWWRWRVMQVYRTMDYESGGKSLHSAAEFQALLQSWGEDWWVGLEWR